jgi:Carboxypeptidase regulatory-like domain
MRRTLLLAAVSVVAAYGAWVSGQVRDRAGAPDATGTAAVSGVVVTAGTRPQPVRHATVSIAGGSLRGSRDSVTDDAGRFLFTGLPSGAYSIEAAKAGWLTSYYGSRRPGVRPFSSDTLQVGDGEHRTDVTLTLVHGAAITGTVRDSNGRPIDARVFTVQPRVRDGVRVYTQPSGLAQSTAQTDDRGVYRLYGLPPGQYLVAAWRGFQLDPVHTGRDDGRTVAYARVYYPGTTDVDIAGVIDLGPDEERTGVDITLTLVPTASVSGTVSLPSGQPPAAAYLEMLYRAASSDAVSRSTTAATFNTATLNSVGSFSGADVQPDGSFRFASISPGHYVLVARAPDRPAGPSASGPPGRGAAAGPMLWAAQDLTMDGRDVGGITLVLRPGISISGRVTAPAGVDLARFVMQLVPSSYSGFAAAPSPVTADGAFRLTGVGPGVYRLRLVERPGGVRGSPGSAVPGELAGLITINGHDAADLPFEVAPGGDDIAGVVATVVGALGDVSGTLRNASGHPAAGYVIVLFAADPAYWTSANRRMPAPSLTARDGIFHFSDLPPGHYYLVAAPDVDPEALRDPATYAELTPVAQRIALGLGEKRVQDFKLGK